MTAELRVSVSFLACMHCRHGVFAVFITGICLRMHV